MSGKTCYWPSGRQAANPMIPCLPYATQSACCSSGDSCTASGLCYEDGIVYRGACTSQNWKDPACPVNCVSAKVGEDTRSDDGVNYLTFCGRNSPAFGGLPMFACSNMSLQADNGRSGFSDCAGTKLFVLDKSSVAPALPITVLTAGASNTSSVNPTCIAQSAGGLPGQGKVPHATVVGASVGASLGVAFLAALAWALWENRQRRAQRRSLERAMGQDQMYLVDKKYGRSEGPPPVELMGSGVVVPEMPTNGNRDSSRV